MSLRLITAFSDICAIEMQKHEFFVQKTGLQYETFLTELLEGRFNDVNIIEARLKLLNRRFGNSSAWRFSTVRNHTTVTCSTNVRWRHCGRFIRMPCPWCIKITSSC